MRTVEDLYPSRVGGEANIQTRKDPVLHADTQAAAKGLTEDLNFFDQQGYLILEDVFSPAEIGTFNDELARLLVDPSVRERGEVILEPSSKQVRSVFNVHRTNQLFKRLASDPRVASVARRILDDEVYIHQSRVNFKPGFDGKEFYWHSDFETWHVEDGMPRMRAVSCSIALTDNYSHNGSLMVIPGSHRYYIACAGATPDDHYKQSLRKQEYGVPDREKLAWLVERGGIHMFTARAGSLIFFDCNTMHGSNGNITPYPRSNVFYVYNSLHNSLQEPFGGTKPRPDYIASRDFSPC